MFLYYWFPGFIFQALSYFSWLSWIKPNNFNLAVVTGSQLGLSFNPWPTFDWNLIGFFNPLSVPFFSFLQQYIGTFIGGLAILGVYFSNNKWTAYLPINSSGLYDNTGNDYNVTKVMTNGRLNEEMYKKYSPPFYTAGNLVLYGAFFLSYPLVFCYVLLDQWKVVVRAYGDVWHLIKESTRKTFTHIKSAFLDLFSGSVKGFFIELSKIFSGGGSVYDGFDDPFTRAIRSYPEVPNWWFYLVVLISFIFSLIILTRYPLGTPVWTIFFVIGINLAFLVPMNLLSSIAGATIGLNVIAELIVGYALPGNPEALMFVKAYGYNIDGQASTYTSDQKMAHYARIPPRAVFRGQVLSTIITSFVGYGIVNFVDNSIQGICTPDQGEHFTCANGSLIYFSSSVIWGLIGPKRIFNDQYPVLKWMFLFGFLLAIAWWSVKKYGPSIREWVKSKAPELVYNVLNWTIFYPISLLRSTQPALVAIGFLEWAPLNLSFQTVGLYFSIYFMYYLRRNKTSWWERYNYVLSAALSAGLAFSGIIVFFAVQYHPQYINWWGNNVVLEGVDGYAGQVALKTELPEKGYFGPDEWA
ncbi:DEKNAAC102483 [Brettanomyces naardenensis]|uniref:DEKNAAC102483 n=1 Tax=Brettanomyces naardenensis TaxID=13370 RepID=A0A448YL73_BRENA|nr:DEKNAAC102483 [Brettanomyces naardenensis]